MAEVTDDIETRGTADRIGVTALNLIAPGLGLLRIGDWRRGLLFLSAPFVLMPVLTLGMGHLPLTSYVRVLIALGVALALMASLYIVAAVLTWRQSRHRHPPGSWSRWYGVTAVAIAIMLLSQFAAPLMHRFYKPFYIPSESMMPTLASGDKLVADMRWRGPFTHGAIILFDALSGARVSRIAALPGDRIAMRNGIPIVNGKAAAQSVQRKVTLISDDGPYPVTIIAERLPGEASAHRILDSGIFEFDDTPEVVVPPNHIFVLGDNRDRSADSRVPSHLSGVGMVPFSAVIGRPMYIHWSSDRTKIGTRLDR